MKPVVATRPIVAAKLAKAAQKRYRHGVLGLRASPSWTGNGFVHDGVPVTVAPCPSTLAVWEALEDRIEGEWLVILTEIDEKDLGDGVLAHLVDCRLLTPDPWDALRSMFAAATIEPALYRVGNDRALAGGLLDVLPTAACTPAPGGVLTRAHAMTAVARSTLAMTDDPATEIDTLAILEWSRRSGAADDLARLRTEGGEDLAGAVTRWLAERAGRLGPAVTALIATGRVGDLVPLGLLAGLLDPAAPQHQLALGRFTERFGLRGVDGALLRAWYEDASALLVSTMSPADIGAVLGAAQRYVRDLGMEALAASSELLPDGLAGRIELLARRIDDVLPAVLPGTPGPPVVATALGDVEAAWEDVQRHLLAKDDSTCHTFSGAIRLVRWLASPDPAPDGLAALTAKYVEVDAWVDAALVRAHTGASAAIPAATLRAVIELAGARRGRSDARFAAALAANPVPDVPVVENLLAGVVFPLAKQHPTLLLVLDALSVGAAIEVVRDAAQTGWTEAAVLESTRRTGALAVLPTLTWRSRCSLLSGELREGQSPAERAGFVAALRGAGLQPAPGVPDPIFHKAALDSRPTGHDLATEVANAVSDTAGRPLVAAVLNYVDETLHHADPGGTTWNLDTITHLRALLGAAQAAGRSVVITSDHGHIIERRQSVHRARKNVYGERAHGDSDRVEEGEVLVHGPRVLTENGMVVLAVAENIRYGPVNAGYHGGGSPAEALVPVIALHTGDRPPTLSALGEVEPDWWRAPIESATPTLVEPSRPAKKTARQSEPSLFDVVDRSGVVANEPAVVEMLVESRIFAEQLKLAGQIRVSREQMRLLVTALLATPSRELTLSRAAGLLSVPVHRVNGALLQVKRVLDVEGYEVLLLSTDSVRLDESLLLEQFALSP